MIVVDASVFTNALTDDGPWGAASRRELGEDRQWSAPEHVLVETLAAIRGLWLGAVVPQQRATAAMHELTRASVTLVSTKQLVGRMWELRANVTTYDAGYIAAAEALECALVTADEKLARVSGVRCPVRLAVPSARP